MLAWEVLPYKTAVKGQRRFLNLRWFESILVGKSIGCLRRIVVDCTGFVIRMGLPTRQFESDRRLKKCWNFELCIAH